MIPVENGARPAYLLHNVGGVGCVLGYSSLDSLVRCCGEHQPWLAVRLDALMRDLHDRQLAGPAIDLPLDQSIWWTADGPPWDLSELIAATEVKEQAT
jgi:hypothetical protein